MRKRLWPLLLLALVSVALLAPVCLGAVNPVQPDAPASLTLHYNKDGKGFPDLQISIHRVAQAFPDGTFGLIAPYASFPVDIHGITRQEQWQQVAQTLNAYMLAYQVQPDVTAATDANGTVRFENLQTGLYMVRQVRTEDAEGTYLFDQFLVYLPTPQPDGSWLYDVQAKPKCTEFVPKNAYSVTKLWKDESDKRPTEVTVDIYKDGILQETQVLSAENDWTYSWYVPDTQQGEWTVAERVPEGYKLTIIQYGADFTLVNATRTPSQTPQTGDSFTPLPWILGLCLSGLVLLLLGIYGRRRK